ncbi:MAG: cadherin-like domain-containing protein [Chitinophagaceae bacterium]|nr:cadherin-like domain-containing protein [Chitinophagaceae bacterium]
MKQIYKTGKWILFSLLLIAFNLSNQKANSQTTCGTASPLQCTSAIPDLCANFTGNGVTAVSVNNLVFTGTSTFNPASLTFNSRTYALVGPGNCVVVKFNEAGTANVTSTDVTITTNTGATITCPGVVLTLGQACVQICDPRLTQGTLINIAVKVSAATFNGGKNVIISNFATVGTSTCALANSFPCPTTFISLNNDCGLSCDPVNFPISAGKIRVFFPTPIPIGEATPLITDVTGVGIALPGLFKFCLNADAGTTVERTYADYCVYTTLGTILPTTGILNLTLQSGGGTPQTCAVSACLGGLFAILNNTTGCPSTPCPGVTGTLTGKVRIFFNTPIPIGTATPVITAATVAGVTLLGYQFCLNADAGTAVVRTYADYCIYTNLLITGNLFPTNLPITFNSATGDICTTPVTVPCASGFVVLNNGSGVCPATPATCSNTFVVVSRLRVYFTPCLPAGIPAPTITGAEGLNALGGLVTPLTGRFCFVTSAESNQLISSTRCYVDYCVYGAAGDTYFNNPDVQLGLTFDFGLLTTINGIQSPFTQTCTAPGPTAGAPVLNPDVNVTSVNVTVPGNVSTNDVVPPGTTYGTPQPNAGNPVGATLTLNPDGTYNFIAPTAGVYLYRVPVCYPGAPTPCPTTELKITVLDNTITVNPPVANTDIAGTTVNTSVIVNVLANDKCSNPGCTLNATTGVTVTVPATNGSATVNGDGTITYMPNPGFTGVDSFTYKVCDIPNPTLLCAIAKVFITVSAASPNTTSAADDYNITNPAVAVTGNVSTNDYDAQGNAQVVTPQNITTANYTFVLNADGSYTFTPIGAFTGPVSIVYTTCDNGVPTVCANATLHILVTPLAGPLPVMLTDFRGVINNKQVVLNWRTSSEINSSHFDVQRSTDGINFESIGTVNAHGNSTVANTYQLLDRAPAQGINYYRLKSVDVDSRFIFSSVISLKFTERANGFVSVNPNPTHGVIRLNFNGFEKGIYKFVLVNPLGQIQLSDQVTISQSVQQRMINTQSSLAKGIYVLHIYKDGIEKISSVKVVID